MAEAEEDNGWQEAGHSGGGGGVTIVQRRRRNTLEDRGGRLAGVFIFSFLGMVESYLKSYLDKS